MGMIAIISVILVLTELGIFNMLLNLPHAAEDKSKVSLFFGSVWPGLIFFMTIATSVTSTLCWWFKI
jgi:hypothetical protein